MFIPSAKSKISVTLLAVISVVLFYFVSNNRNLNKVNNYEEKIKAAKLMLKAEKVIKKYRQDQGVYIDEVNDAGKTGLIGEKNTLITTDRGSLTSKLTTLNPNFAAVVLDYFIEAGLKKDDTIAISCTGSFPALNLAVFSAAKVLGLKLEIISSVGASMFGATDPNFTWLDIESLLIEKNIFDYKSIAASLGGGRDLGRGLNIIGREKILEAIKRNKVTLIKENSLSKNIKAKMDLFDKKNKDYKLYVNIGGGLSSLGNSVNGKLVDPGFIKNIETKNIPLKGTMFLFAEKNIPLVHLLDIVKIAETYNLPIAPDPLPKVGDGKVFQDERYNLVYTSIALGILSILILIIILFDHKEMKLREDEVNKK